MLMGGVEDCTLLSPSQPPPAGEGLDVQTGGVEGRALHKNPQPSPSSARRSRRRRQH
jgi:hypothetical protein